MIRDYKPQRIDIGFLVTELQRIAGVSVQDPRVVDWEDLILRQAVPYTEVG